MQFFTQCRNFRSHTSIIIKVSNLIIIYEHVLLYYYAFQIRLSHIIAKPSNITI